jgi:hypothetical protein
VSASRRITQRAFLKPLSGNRRTSLREASVAKYKCNERAKPIRLSQSAAGIEPMPDARTGERFGADARYAAGLYLLLVAVRLVTRRALTTACDAGIRFKNASDRLGIDLP